MSSTMTPGPVAGIDFGTCWSSVVVRRTDGSLVRVKEPVSGSPSVPSSVVLAVDGGLSWGTAAENVKRSRPYQSQFKRRWGEPEPLLLGELGVTAVELVAGFVGWLRGLAEATVGEPLASVVATVPAAYEGHRRELMVHAMAQAGFAEQAVRLEVEPVAAARFALADRPAFGVSDWWCTTWVGAPSTWRWWRCSMTVRSWCWATVVCPTSVGRRSIA